MTTTYAVRITWKDGDVSWIREVATEDPQGPIRSFDSLDAAESEAGNAWRNLHPVAIRVEAVDYPEVA